MSSKITFSLWDKENNVLYTGGAVRIFEGADCNGTKVASTEAGEIIGDVVEIFETSGLYYVTGLDTAVYSMSLNAQPLVNLTNIILVGIDLVTHLANADIHSELDDTETSSDTKIWSINQIKTKIAEISGYAPDDISIQLNVDDELEVKAINGSIITDASIPAAKLATDSVETAKIKDANITVAKINYDTNDFEPDGTKLSIKQSFLSEEILNEGKSLNENLGRLQSRLKGLEGSIGGIKRRILYSDFERATGATNNEAVDYRTYGVDVNVYKTILRIPYLKQNGDLTMNIYFYSTGDSSATGLFTLNYGGSDVIEKGMGDGLGDGVISYDISGEPNGALTAILLKLKTNSDGHEVFVSKIIIEITSGE